MAPGVLPLLLACAGGGGAPSPGPGSDTLQVAVEVPARVRTGEAVPITLRVTNVGDERLDLELRGRPIAFDLVVTGPDGSVVWRRLEGRTVPAILQVRTLGPRESLELRDVWDQRERDGSRVAPGSYRVAGAVPAVSPGALEASPEPLLILPERR